MPRSLRTITAVLPTVLDHGDSDEAALVVPDDEGRAGVGAHVHLARHHLLHGEVAGQHRKFFGLDAVLLESAGLHQVIGRHAPDVGLVALADGRLACAVASRAPSCAQRQRDRAGRAQKVAAVVYRLAELSSLSSVECFCCVDWMLCGGAGQGRVARAGLRQMRPPSVLLHAELGEWWTATSSSVLSMICLGKLAGVEESAGIEPPGAMILSW